MAEAKYSKMLEMLFENARSISGSTLTAEKFIVSIINCVKTNSHMDNEEIVAAVDLLRSVNEDLDGAFDALVKHIADMETSTQSHELYMQRMLFSARFRSGLQPNTTVSTLDVLRSIIADPSDSIRKAFKLSDGKGSSAENYSQILKMLSKPPTATTHSDPSGAAAGTAAGGSDARSKQAETQGDAAAPDFAKNKAELTRLIEKVKQMQEVLLGTVLGQDNAVNVFTSGYFQAEVQAMTEKKRARPRATFLFAGPPGVGKTFLAEMTAEVLGLPFARFDMSEYTDNESSIEFCGSDKVYKNGKAGNVTGFVAAHPKCVLLFDEIEKAHLNVIHLFLQMLDAGRLRDNFTDVEVPFTDAIIILTTNAGKQLYEASDAGEFSNVSRKVILKALQGDINPVTGGAMFPAAICSRFASGNVVMFNHIGAHDLHTIAKREAVKQAADFEREMGIEIEFSEDVFSALLFAEGGSADARTVRSRAAAFLDGELYELLRLIASDRSLSSISDLRKIRFSVELPDNNDDVLYLFRPKVQPKALVFSSQEIISLCESRAVECGIVGAGSVEDAVAVLRRDGAELILLDFNYGLKSDSSNLLNTEDIQSLARDLYHIVREKFSDVPVYFLQPEGVAISAEEKLSLLRQGIRDVVQLSDSFGADLDEICSGLHQQVSMDTLARANKVATYETSQRVVDGGATAEVSLFDFTMSTAVDAGDSRNILSSVSKPNVRFDEVIGAEEAKKELRYFVEYLKDPKKFTSTGVRAPRGVLLYGPPGTGKTMLAKAMASESGVTFIAAEGNQFIKKYIGEGQEEVHNIFRTARKYAPAILFIDEIDAIARSRTGEGEGTAEKEATLTAFLAEMDGFSNDSSKPVFVLAATNFEVEPGRAKSLDPALMRRFDRRIYIDLPDRDDRMKYLKMKIAANSAFELSDEELDNIAIRSTGMSLAELESIIELALRSAIRDGGLKVTDEIFEDAFETFTGGEVKKWDASQLERVARHEAGHAFLCWQGGETPSYLTVVARGDHGGYMLHGDNEGKMIFTKDELLARIRTSLGGRAAEIVYYGEKDGMSTGASGDLSSATRLARQIICTYGMAEEFGLAVIDQDSARFSELSSEVRDAVNKILADEMKKAVELISAHKNCIDALVEQLLVKNHMNGAEIDRVLGAAYDK